MNHIAEKKGEHADTIVSAPSFGADSKWFLLLVFPAMLVHSFVAYAERPFESSIALELFFGMLNFVAVVIMYYGISRMAYAGRYILLGLCAVMAVTGGAALSKNVTMLSMAAGWSAVLLTPLFCGTQVASQQSLPKIYAAALVILTVFVSVQLFPLWSQMYSSAADVADAITADVESALSLAGFTAEQIDNAVKQFKAVYSAFVRILPAFSIMAAMFQFTAGFWLFARWLNRSGSRFQLPVNFVKWQMPFALMPLLVTAILMRLFGNELLVLIADNMILILAVFYAVAGISFVEFLMKKFRFAFFSRFLVYLLFLLTHVVGLAFLALLGFADSYFCWRRKYPLPLDYKSG